MSGETLGGDGHGLCEEIRRAPQIARRTFQFRIQQERLDIPGMLAEDGGQLLPGSVQGVRPQQCHGQEKPGVLNLPRILRDTPEIDRGLCAPACPQQHPAKHIGRPDLIGQECGDVPESLHRLGTISFGGFLRKCVDRLRRAEAGIKRRTVLHEQLLILGTDAGVDQHIVAEADTTPGGVVAQVSAQAQIAERISAVVDHRETKVMFPNRQIPAGSGGHHLVVG